MHANAAFSQCFGKSLAHAGVVRGQNRGRGGEQIEAQIFGVATQALQLIAQPKLHRQQQLHAACACAHHGNRGFSGMAFHAFQQRQPAVIEIADRFDRHRMLSRARYALELRGGADIDGKLVVGHGRATLAQHFLIGTVNADHLIAVHAGFGKRSQSQQIDVHRVVVVMPCHIAWQHAGVGGVQVGADQREAHAGNRLHAEAFQNAHMAVAAANEHDVAQDRGIRGLHSSDQSFCHERIQIRLLAGWGKQGCALGALLG